MSKTAMTAAFAALLAVSMPLAWAQTAANTNAAKAPPAAAPATTSTGNAPPATPAPAAAMPTHIAAGQMRYSDMDGATVYDSKDKSIGDINNVVLDPDGKVAVVVVKTGGFIGIGGKTVAVRMSDLKIATDKNGKPRFTLDMTKQQLQSAQAYDPTPPKNTASGGSNPPASAAAPAGKGK